MSHILRTRPTRHVLRHGALPSPRGAWLALGGIGLSAFHRPPRTAQHDPAPALDEPATEATSEVAVLAGGCFWGVQGVFQHVEGVTSAVSGYAGGDKDTAHYETVSTGTTGHAESVQVTFDPRKISYGRILQIYFSVAHDPTELNRQGPDIGHAISLGDLPDDAGAGARRQGLYRPARPGARVRRGDRHQRSSPARASIRPRTIIRTS